MRLILLERLSYSRGKRQRTLLATWRLPFGKEPWANCCPVTSIRPYFSEKFNIFSLRVIKGPKKCVFLPGKGGASSLGTLNTEFGHPFHKHTIRHWSSVLGKAGGSGLVSCTAKGPHTHGCSLQENAFPRERLLNRNHSRRYGRPRAPDNTQALLREPARPWPG